MAQIISDLVRGMERAVLESVARRWKAVGLALSWSWEGPGDGDDALRIDAWIDGQETPILVSVGSDPGWYEVVHGCGETLAAGDLRDVVDALIYWVERVTPRQIRLN